MRISILLGLFLVGFSFLFGQKTEKNKSEPIVKKIAFGSCADQNKPQPILQRVDSMKPNLFVYLGDNIYADSKHFTIFNIARQYKKLAKKPEFQQLKSHVPIIATWDDHDYGVNDGGKEFKGKEKSKKLFLKFWAEPQNSPRWSQLGIYTSYYYKTVGNKTVQVILLDTRTFRSSLVEADLTNGYDKNDYAVTNNVRATILGGTQWKWLERELFKKADIRIIGSSTQFATEYNGYESWANFPLEQVRMYDVIEKTKANGVIFISGDVHYAELNAVLPEGMYPLYDLTASGITEKWDHVEPSRYRRGKAFQENHFGMIEFEEDKKNKEVLIHLGIYDVEGEKHIAKTLNLSALQFSTKK